jgi:hypothetical protein
MFGRILLFIGSIILTNWLYAESVLFIPSVEPYFTRIAQVFRLPTHNEWPAMADSKEAQELERQLLAFKPVAAEKNAVQAVLRAGRVQASGDSRFREKYHTDLFDRGQGSVLASGAAVFSNVNSRGFWASGAYKINFKPLSSLL